MSRREGAQKSLLLYYYVLETYNLIYFKYSIWKYKTNFIKVITAEYTYRVNALHTIHTYSK